MDKALHPKTMVSNHLLDTFLTLMAADIRTMIYEKTDRLVSPQHTHPLNDKELKTLKTALQSVEGLHRRMVNSPGERDGATMTVAMICDCPVHARHLEEAGIATLTDLVNCDPLKLMEVLSIAEAASGVRHLHLYCWRWFKLDLIVKEMLNKRWRLE